MNAPRPQDDDPMLAWLAADPSRAVHRAAVDAVSQRTRAAWAWFRASPAFCERFAAAVAAPGMLDLHWEDLALLDGFQGGQPQAASVMQRTVTTRLMEVLVNQGASEAEADDLIQERFCDLIDRTEGAAGYAGSGTLIGWLKRGLVRDLGRLRERERRQARRQPEVEVPGRFDVESALTAHQHRPHLRAVLREVFLTLSSESRRILRLVHAGGLSAQQVGVLMGLHRVTVQRRLGELRAELAKETRRRLAARFGLDESTIAALLDATPLAFETTLSSVLATPMPE